MIRNHIGDLMAFGFKYWPNASV